MFLQNIVIRTQKTVISGQERSIPRRGKDLSYSAVKWSINKPNPDQLQGPYSPSFSYRWGVKLTHSSTSTTALWMVNCTHSCVYTARNETSVTLYITNSLQNIIILCHFSHLGLSLYLKAKWPEKHICTVHCQGTICINDVLHQYLFATILIELPFLTSM
jgi:hypothetical protein